MARKCDDGCISSDRCHKDEWTLEDWTKKGWTSFIHEITPRFYRFFVAKLESKEDAHEAVQETFTRFFEYFDNYDENRPLLPWLIRIARNVSNDILRERYRFSTVPLNENYVDDSPESSVEEDVVLETTIDWIIRTVRLNKLQAAILILSVEEDLGPSDIANVLNEAPENIRQHLWRLRNKIKERIGREEI